MREIIERFYSLLKVQFGFLIGIFVGLLTGIVPDWLSMEYGFFRGVTLIVIAFVAFFIIAVVIAITIAAIHSLYKYWRRKQLKPISFEPLGETYKGLIVSISRLNDSYLFNWDNISECDKERLRKFLKDDLDLGWVEDVEIPKLDANQAIRISKDGNTVEITINEKKEKATLKISDGRTLNLKIKKENGELKIYTATKDQVINKINSVKDINNLEDLNKLFELRGVGQTFRAIIHHRKKLKVCWLLYTEGSVEAKEVVELFIKKFALKLINTIHVRIDDPYNLKSIRKAVDEIYVKDIEDEEVKLQETDVIADITGGTTPMSSAIILACTSSDRKIEYVEQDTNALIKVEHF